MVNLKETASQLIQSSVYGFVTKISAIFLSIWMDKFMNHSLSNFIGLVINAFLSFFLMKKVFKVEEEESKHFISRYTISICIGVIVAQLLYMATAAYAKKYHKKWYKEKWGKYVFWIRYITGATAYGFFEFPLHKFWVFKK